MSEHETPVIVTRSPWEAAVRCLLLERFKKDPQKISIVLSADHDTLCDLLNDLGVYVTVTVGLKEHS